MIFLSIIDILISTVSEMDEVESVGISGNKVSFPKVGEGDIDIFIYCNKIPEPENRQRIIKQLGDTIQESKIDIFQGGHWGTGDLVLINHIETWLMYFTSKETLWEVESILNGEYPDKLDNYYYPIGRCAMLKDINVLYDENNFLDKVKKRLCKYPDMLSNTLVKYHLAELEDTEDLKRAVLRKDVLFYHFAIDIAIDHFLQGLFAINKIYFPSRKRSLDYIRNFNIKPERCNEKLLEVIRLGSSPEGIRESFVLWSNMVDELNGLGKFED